MKKGLILQEDITIFNMYMPNNRISNYMKQELSKEKQINPLSLLETSTPLYQKWTDPAGRKT